MTGAVRIIPSQPLGFLAPKTASGGKIRAHRVASEKVPRNRLYRLGKIPGCKYDPTGPHIFGNTIGNAVAQGVEEASNTAAQGQGGNGGGITAMQDPGPVQMAPIDTSALDSMNLQLVSPSGAGVGGEAGSVQVGDASGTQGSLKYDAVINVINGTAVVQSAPMVLGANGEFSPGNSDGGSFVITNTNGQTYQLGWNNSLDQSGNVTGRQFYANGMPIGSANGSATSIALGDRTNINYTPPPITSNDSNEQIVVTGPPSACAQAIS